VKVQTTSETSVSVGWGCLRILADIVRHPPFATVTRSQRLKSELSFELFFLYDD